METVRAQTRRWTLGGLTPLQTFAEPNVVELVLSAIRGDVIAVCDLADRGVNPNTIGINGSTPLFWALYARSHYGIEALLRIGADPNLATAQVGLSPMYLVAGGDDVQILSSLLRHGGNANHKEQGDLSERPLARAAIEGRIENLKLLIKHGADVNAHNKFGESIGTLAIAAGQFEAVIHLLQNGYMYNLDRLFDSARRRHIVGDKKALQWKERILRMVP